MASLSANLKILMDFGKINASELARRTGIAQPIIHRLSTGQNTNPKLATIKPISEHFMVTVSQLIGEMALPAEAELGRLSTEHKGWNKVPLINWHDALQWDKATARAVAAGGATYVSTDAPVSKNAYALVIKGQTMEPLFTNGMTIVVEPERVAIDRDFVVVHIYQDVEARLKQVLFDGPDLYLKSLNPDFEPFGPVKLKTEDKILGVMAQAKIDF